MNWSKAKIFGYGVLAATLGYRILRSRDAKKVYTVLTAAVLREKDRIMEEVTNIREDVSDIYADAKARNETLAAEETIIEDRSGQKNAEAAEA